MASNGNVKGETGPIMSEKKETEPTTKEAPATEGNGDKEKGDAYAYTRREEFTSENFKIELRGLPRYYTVAHLKKLLNETLQLEAHKVKPVGHHGSLAYVTFRDEPARVQAMKVLQGYKWKKANFSVAKAKPVEDPLIKVRGEGSNNWKDQIPDQDSNLTIEERVTKSVTPYAHLPYDKQLELKQKEALNILRKLGNDLAHVNPAMARIIKWQKQRRGGQLCEVDDIIPSPQTEGYRNKCEFTVGVNPESGEATVGFRLASYKAGSMCVAPVSHLKNIPQVMKDVVLEFEKFVRGSDLAPFSPMSHEGVWRQLTVRTTTTKSVLIIVMIHPQNLDDSQQQDLKQNIVKHFTQGSASHIGVTSIFFKAYAQKERGDSQQLDHLHGEKHLTETVLGNTFRVSPDAFLQVNTPGAEVLYKRVGELAQLDDSSVLLDVCCGTGTIGVCLAKRCNRVCGVELVSEAAEDARENAQTNGANNVKVWTGRAEDTLPHLLESCRGLKTVAVVDPPRAGLNTGVTVGLRRCSEVGRMVYVSCDPALALKNFIGFGRPQSKKYQGPAFFPVRAVPVDLFPHTPHFELIILFERWQGEKWSKIMEGEPLPEDEEYYKRIPALTMTFTDQKKENSEENGKRTLEDSSTPSGVEAASKIKKTE